MQAFLCKVFGIYPGEGTKSFRFARFSMLWALGLTINETLSDGLFLEKVGSHSLSIVFFVAALSTIGISAIILYSLRLTSPYRILTIALSIGILSSLIASFFLLQPPPALFYFIFKISSRILFVILLAYSWTFIDQYHDLQDAKRVYALYSAAYFFGSILSGSLINRLLATIGYSSLLGLAALAFLFAFREVRHIALKTPAAHDDSQDGVFSGDRSGFSSIVTSIFRSPFTILLLSLSLMIQLLMTVSEFNYMATFASHFPEGHISEFLGKCRAWISSCNILTGVFFYSRFVRRIGVNNVLLVTPITFVLVYSQWVTYDTLLIAILGLIAVDGVLFTVEDNCFNLLTNVVPAKLKSKVRIINDSFFEPIGMLFTSLLLFGIQEKSRLLGLILALFALTVTFALRALYSKSILINLKENTLHFHRTLKDWLSSTGRQKGTELAEELLASIANPCEETRLFACESLLLLKNLAILPQILDALQKFGTLNKIRFLQLLETSSFSNEPVVIQAISTLLSSSESLEFSKCARFYLAKRGIHSEEALKGADSEESDLLSRGTAMLALHQESADEIIDLMLQSHRIDEIGLALDLLGNGSYRTHSQSSDEPDQALEKAAPFLFSESILVKRSAARCFVQRANRRATYFAPRLIEALDSARDNLFRLSCLDALDKINDLSIVRDLLLVSVHFRPNERRRTEEMMIQLGLEAAPILLSLIKDLSIPDRARILSAKILSRLALPQLQANLLALIKIELDRAYFYFYSGHSIQNKYPLYDLELLTHALKTGFRSVIDFIIHLMGAAGYLEDPELLVRTLRSRNAKIQSHAVESLEKTCDPRLFKQLVPLIDDLPLQEKLKACLRYQTGLPILSLSSLFARLEESSSLYDKTISTRLKGTHNETINVN